MKSLITTILIAFMTLSCSRELPPVPELVKEAETANWEDGVKESIIINAPIQDVWTYASNSNNAKDWSVFFDHISPLPGIPDGQIGALRRCHRMPKEDGPYWDEVVTEVIPLQRRQITTYNLNGFSMNFLAKGQYAFVRQLYRPIDEKTTEMSFLTIPSPSANLFGKLGFYLSRKDTAKIFKENLENIKAMIEGKPRVHAWY